MLILKITETLSTKEEELGVTRIAPVWGATMSATEYFAAVSQGQRMGLDLLTPSELGCTLAHLTAYKRVIDENRPALIIEDDISLDKIALERVRTIALTQLDFIHCATYEQFQFRGKQSGPDLWLIDPRADFWGTAAYWISVDAAKRLKDFHAASPRKADDWASFFTRCEIAPYFSPIFFHPRGTGSLETERQRHIPMNARALIGRRFRSLFSRHGYFYPRLAEPIPGQNVFGSLE